MQPGERSELAQRSTRRAGRPCPISLCRQASARPGRRSAAFAWLWRAWLSIGTAGVKAACCPNADICAKRVPRLDLLRPPSTFKRRRGWGERRVIMSGKRRRAAALHPCSELLYTPWVGDFGNSSRWPTSPASDSIVSSALLLIVLYECLGTTRVSRCF